MLIACLTPGKRGREIERPFSQFLAGTGEFPMAYSSNSCFPCEMQIIGFAILEKTAGLNCMIQFSSKTVGNI